MHGLTTKSRREDSLVKIPADGVQLEANLEVASSACGVVIFAHGSGSSRHSPRNRYVAGTLRSEGLGTLLIDLLTTQEDAVYENRFDIDLLSWRLERATQWLMEQPGTDKLGVGYFGASTGAAAALNAAATFGTDIAAVVSRGGRPDLAIDALARVKSPTLLIVGGLDNVVNELNRRAFEKLNSEKKLVTVPGATHLFEEPGSLEEVARLAADWFKRHLKK